MAYQLVGQRAVGTGMLPAPVIPASPVVPGAVVPPVTAPAGLLSMPDFAYDNSGLALAGNGRLLATDLIGDYYKQMTEGYLPTLDTFAQSNAGKMVAFDPNKLMSIEDFGLETARGALRNRDLSKASHNLLWTQEGDTFTPAFYTRTADGQYVAAQGKEGEELFTLTRSEPMGLNPDGVDVWTQAGMYHKETAQEAADRLLTQGGGYATGARKDFMGETTLSDLTTQADGKWGQDFVNMPELKPYLDDPAWVTKTDGKVTAVRAELLPLMLRESIGEEYRDMARGTTKDANGLGDLVKMVVIGTVTAGFGSGIAAAAGGTLSGATGLAGLTSFSNGVALTNAGLVGAGAAGGALSAGLQGGNILEGAALGGLGAAASPFISKPLAGAGLTNPTLNAGATKAITSGLSAAIKGDDIGVGAVAGGITGMITSLLPGTGNKMANGAINSVVGNVVSGYVSQLMNPASGSTMTAAPTSNTAAPSTTPATQAPTTLSNRYYAAQQGRVII